MIITIDIGNTNIVIGGIRDNEIEFVSRVSTDIKKTEYEYASLLKNILELKGKIADDVSGAIISSVVPPINQLMKKAVELVCGVTPIIVGPGIKTGVNLLVDNPLQVGADIICAVVAVRELYSQPSIVLDMGTATKLSVCDENGAFIGVSIIPGVELGLTALASGAAQLPQISLEAPKRVIGKNTVECMCSGIIYGNASMIDGMIQRINEERGCEHVVVATGGLAGAIIPHCKSKIVTDNNLILKGLKILYEKNHKM